MTQTFSLVRVEQSLLPGPPPEQNAIDEEVSRTLQAYTDSFLGEMLDYGGAPGLWQGPSVEYPRVIHYERE